MKPDYKKDRMKNPLDYSFFGEYKKKYKNKIIFTGGFGSNTEVKIMQRRLFSHLMINERKTQLNNIIKLYNNTFKQQVKTIEIKSPGCHLTERANSKNTKRMTRNLISLQPIINPYDRIDSTKITSYSRNNSINSIHNNKSTFQVMSPSLPVMSTKDELNEKNNKKHLIFATDVIKERFYRNKSELSKYDLSIFKKGRYVLDKKDRNYLFERLKLKHRFYMKDNESEFEKKKNRMFEKKHYDLYQK